MDITETFGCMVFNDAVMKDRLPANTYNTLKKTISEGSILDKNIADTVASAMKYWAIENGCTHYTHWFQPMTGITAEKHESFIWPSSNDSIIMEFSGKELVKGESDASSFPSGGLRATFEARGYTAWDPTSYAFIKENTLCIPTIFCSYTGESLDKKTPLLRSMSAVSKQAERICKFFDNKTKHVFATAGAEQEYFLVEKEFFEQRKDLIYTGRTIFGNKPPKGQELNDHYFGSIPSKIKDYMTDLDQELWKLGVFAKTEHNEVAPCQFELAPVFSPINTATDQNQLTMEIMKKVAERHGLKCILHEKPFKGINGSGKHNNWSLNTDDGGNLLNSKNAYKNKQFLLFLIAVIKAVDENQDLLRASVASAGNDHRLGGNEAPPAIISMYIGAELEDLLETISNNCSYDPKIREEMHTGVESLPIFKKDTSDRNRTSPIAFTGNKFEFRMPGSSASIASPNIVINTIVADALESFADILDKSQDIESDVTSIISENYKLHKRILFNGNNYSDEWVKEAHKRGLSDLKTTVDALPAYISDKSIHLFTKHKIFTEAEIRSRYEILMQNYPKKIFIEANTMLSMARKQIIPAIVKYSKLLSETYIAKKNAGVHFGVEVENNLLKDISCLNSELLKKVNILDDIVVEGSELSTNNVEDLALYCRDKILPAMNDVRSLADMLENDVSEEYWPYPTYDKLLSM